VNSRKSKVNYSVNIIMERLTQGKDFEEYQNALNQGLYNFILYCLSSTFDRIKFLMILVKFVERNAAPNGVAIVDPKRSGKRGADDLVTLAREIQHADVAIKNSACSKLTIIAEQVRFLQNQARKILEESEQNANLHHAACNFQKVPGKIYHLYKRESGQTYFSMLAPEVRSIDLKNFIET
jgi:Protein of unknown function (DUF2452)